MIDVVSEVVDEVLDHLQVGVELLQAVEDVLLFVVVLEQPPADVHLFVDVGVLEELQPEVAAPQGDVTLRASSAPLGEEIQINTNTGKYLHEQQLNTALAEVVAAHVHHQLHGRVAILGGLAPRAHRVHPEADDRL
jgi:hypothetical protein